jgi:type I restriction enzyme S subunit
MTTVNSRKLGDLASITVGHVGPMATEYQSSGVPFLRSQNVKPFRLDMTDVKYVSEGFHARLQKSALKPGDVVVVRTGTPGVAAVIPESLAASNCSDLVIIRPGSDLDSRYLAYFINGAAQGYVDSRTVGAVQQHFNIGAARELRLPELALADQRAIAEVLGALDEKIDSNTTIARRADELWYSEQAQVLNGWDVDNDTALPAGWSRTPLSSLARFVNGRNFTKAATGSGRMVVRIAELNSGPGRSTVYNTIEVPDDHIVRPGDLLFAWSGSLTVQRWYRPEAIVNQHIFKVIPTPAIPLWMVHGYLLQLLPWYRQVAADKATTMGHIQRHHLDEGVILPDASAREQLDKRCGPLWNRALAAERESLVLADLRNALLPHLLSGEIRVREVEALVGEAV